MSQIKDHLTVLKEWGLSNPQYFPDDSAPPIPSCNISTVEENSYPFQQTGEQLSLGVGDKSFSSDSIELSNFTGVPNTTGFDYTTGVTQLDIDHIFYSYLNSEIQVPFRHLTGYDALKHYALEFIPALCGLYTIEIPTGGEHLYFLDNEVSGSSTMNNNYAINYLGRLMYSGRRAGDIITELYPRKPKRYSVLDFIFDRKALRRVANNYTYSTTTISPYYNITFELTPSNSNRDLVATVLLQDKSTDNQENVVIGNFNVSGFDFNELFFFRLDFDSDLVQFMFRRGGSENYSVETRVLNSKPAHLDFSVNGISSGTRYFGAMVQAIGYNYNVGTLENTYSNVIRPKEFGYLLFSESAEDTVNFALPPYTGNAWTYINKLASVQPYKRVI